MGQGRDKKERNRQKQGSTTSIGAIVGVIRERANTIRQADREEGRKAGIEEVKTFLMEQRNKLTRRVADYEVNYNASKHPSVALDVETLENNISLLNILIREVGKL